jgi:hypothetical protein
MPNPPTPAAAWVWAAASGILDKSLIINMLA